MSRSLRIELADGLYHITSRGNGREANLSAGMRQLGGVNTQRSSRQHGRVGRVFQGRYKVLVHAVAAVRRAERGSDAPLRGLAEERYRLGWMRWAGEPEVARDSASMTMARGA